MSSKKVASKIEQISDVGSTFIGSSASLVLHTVVFACFFVAGLLGYEWSTLLLILTTIVSLEAIYLSIFIQMSVNRNTKSLEEVEEDIEEIQGDIDEIQTDVDEIQEDVVEIVKEDQHVLHELETLEDIEKTLAKLQEDIIQLRKQKI